MVKNDIGGRLSFAAGEDLSEAIRHVTAGDNARCAVAFWGVGSDSLFSKGDRKKARIICDVMMGNTSPIALKALGAPSNDNLRHFKYLHTKVYISDNGAVVGSANASKNGVGFERGAESVEAGMVILRKNPAFEEIADWFEQVWEKAQIVDQAALETAERRFKPHPKFNPRPIRAGSLLDMVVADPDAFSKLSFVFIKKDLTRPEEKSAREKAIATHKVAQAKIENLPFGNTFAEWDADDIDNWEKCFVEFWLPKRANQLKVFGRTIICALPEKGILISQKNWSKVKDQVKPALPNYEEIQRNDLSLAKRIIDKHGDVLFSAEELAGAISKL
jgi:hypothetical protein